MGGLVGAFVIVPKNATDELPVAFSAMRRKTLVFTHVFLNSTTSEDTDPFTVWSFTTLSKKMGSKLDISPVYRKDSIRDAWFVNGLYQPTQYLYPNEWIIFDMVAASGDRIMGLEIRTGVGYKTGSLACNVKLLAVDGVYLQTARTGDAVTHLTMLQAQRATIAVMCSSAGTYYLQTVGTTDSSYKYSKLGDLEIMSNQNLMFLKVTGLRRHRLPSPLIFRLLKGLST